jgi:hypothetical protein
MSNRNSNKPLEWQFGYINTTDATITNHRIELGLRDDEVAEIHKIDSSIAPVGFTAGGADDVICQTMALSMDPDVGVDPAVAINNNDLEWFYLHKHDIQQELVTTGLGQVKLNDQKSEDYDPPILVGTDIGIVVHNDAAVNCESWARVYFTRRKANVQELNQILLKRR